MRRSVTSFTCLLLFIAMSTAQLPVVEDHRSVGFRYENDFFSATDRYLTQDVTVRWTAPFIARLPSARVLLRLKNGSVRSSFLIEQQCYTPSSIRRDTVFTGERPFAAAMFAGQQAISIDAQHGLRLTSAYMLGILGPCAVCAEEQRGIHKALDNIEPLGWQYQVATSPIVNYAVRMDKRVWGRSFAEASGGVGAEAGTYRTNATLHGRFELGGFPSAFAPLSQPDRKLRLSVEVNGQVKAVAHDASMQGGWGDDASVYVLPPSAVERVVLRGGYAVYLSYKRFGLTYSKVYLTREFNGGMAHGWGGLDFNLSF